MTVGTYAKEAVLANVPWAVLATVLTTVLAAVMVTAGVRGIFG